MIVFVFVAITWIPRKVKGGVEGLATMLQGDHGQQWEALTVVLLDQPRLVLHLQQVVLHLGLKQYVILQRSRLVHFQRLVGRAAGRVKKGGGNIPENIA